METLTDVAPYAPSRTVVAVLRSKRDKPSQAYFDARALDDLGISESLIPRTLQALRLYGLLDEDGKCTSAFEYLVAEPDDMPRRLEQVLRAAYAPVFEVMDATTATSDELELAFEQFRPPGQRGRMVTLFMNLMVMAKMRDRASLVEGDPRATGVSVPRRTLPVKQHAPAAPNRGRSASSAGTTSYEVQLNSGGAVQVLLDIDLFQLSKADREFVMTLVDSVTSYTSN